METNFKYNNKTMTKQEQQAKKQQMAQQKAQQNRPLTPEEQAVQDRINALANKEFIVREWEAEVKLFEATIKYNKLFSEYNVALEEIKQRNIKSQDANPLTKVEEHANIEG